MHSNITNDPFDPDKSIVDVPHGHGPTCDSEPRTEVQQEYESKQSPEFRGMEHFHSESRTGPRLYGFYRT